MNRYYLTGFYNQPAAITMSHHGLTQIGAPIWPSTCCEVITNPDNVPSAPPPRDTPDDDPIDPQQPDHTCTPDPTKTKAHRKVVGVENAEGEAYGKATGFYNNHQKYSTQLNPWHQYLSAHDIQQAHLFSQQRKTWIDWHQRRRLDDIQIESCTTAYRLQMLLSELDFVLSDPSWIDDNSYIFRTLYYRDIFQCMAFLLAHLPIQTHLDFTLVYLADSEGCQMYSRINMGYCWWDTQDRPPAGASIVPVICASHKTHLTNISGDHHAWHHHLAIGNFRNDVHWTHKKYIWILVGLIPCPMKSATNIDEGWHITIEIVLSQLEHLDITGPGSKWDCADGFMQQCYALLAARVGDHPDHFMVAQSSSGSCLMCAIPNGGPKGHSTFLPLDSSRDQPIYSELLEDTNIDALHIVGVHSIHNYFWQYSLCNVYRFWQPDELHQLLLGLVKDLLHCLLNHLTARYVKNWVDNQFTSIPPYPGLHHFPKPFDWLKCSTWQGKEIHEMIRILAVHCTPFLYSKNDGKTAAETASDKMVMGTVQALFQFCLLVNEKDHSDLSLKALGNVPRQFSKKNGNFWEQTMSKSAKAIVDNLLARESHQVCDQKIHKMCTAMEVLVSGAEKISLTKCRQFQLCLNRTQKAATTVSKADRQSAIERSEWRIH